jgi:hypothetical protein
MTRELDSIYYEEYSCPFCGWRFYYEEDGNWDEIPADDEYEEIYGEYDENNILTMPEACRGCNPNYPDCKTSCKLFNP